MQKQTGVWLLTTLAMEGVMFGMLSINTASAGDLIPYCRAAKVRCSIPNYAYQSQSYHLSPPASAESFSTLLLESTAQPLIECSTAGFQRPGDTRTVRFWQLSKGALEIDHCAISRVGVSVDDFGHWTVNLRASQDPFFGVKRQAEPAVRFKRNRFVVTVRGYGAAPLRETTTQTNLGKAELFRIEVPDFWVDRSDVVHVREVGRLSPVEMRTLSLVDRIEVDFRYE